MPEADDKNKGAGDGSGQGGAGNGAGAGADTVSIPKAEFEKLNSDLGNYKTGMTKYKKDAEDLTTKLEAAEKEKKEKGGEGSGQGGVVMDETKVKEFAETHAASAATKVLRDASQTTAKSIFLKNHPEYKDDANWVQLAASLTLKGDEITSEQVMDRFESALLEHKRKTGKLDEYLASREEQARREGRIEGELGQGRGSGASGDKGGSENKGSLSPAGEAMARAMHTDPEKVKKVDLSKDNVIDVMTAPKK